MMNIYSYCKVDTRDSTHVEQEADWYIVWQELLGEWKSCVHEVREKSKKFRCNQVKRLQETGNRSLNN